MYLFNPDPKKTPYHIDLVSDYDCWQYKYDPDTTNFKLGIESVCYDALSPNWLKLNADPEIRGEEIKKHIKNGKAIKRYIDSNNEYYRTHYAYESEIEGYKCLVVNKKSNSWVFGDQYDKYPLVMVWVFDGETYSYSIFSSNDEIDCSKIAEKYGGGGHKGAAGFSSKELLFKKV